MPKGRNRAEEDFRDDITDAERREFEQLNDKMNALCKVQGSKPCKGNDSTTDLFTKWAKCRKCAAARRALVPFLATMNDGHKRAIESVDQSCAKCLRFIRANLAREKRKLQAALDALRSGETEESKAIATKAIKTAASRPLSVAMKRSNGTQSLAGLKSGLGLYAKALKKSGVTIKDGQIVKPFRKKLWEA